MSDLERTAIERLKAASEMSLQYYGQPLVITDSGGKDSCLWASEIEEFPMAVTKLRFGGTE